MKKIRASQQELLALGWLVREVNEYLDDERRDWKLLARGELPKFQRSTLGMSDALSFVGDWKGGHEP